MSRARAILRARPLEALILVCALAFAGLAADVVAGGALTRLDVRVVRWDHEHAPDRIERAARTWTHLGSGPILALVVVVAALLLAALRRRRDAWLLVAAFVADEISSAALKLAIHRHRPPFATIPLPASFSFPSGHTSGAFTVYVLVALLVGARLPRAARALLVAAALAWAAAIGATRVLLGVHYLTDVLAGACLGLALVATTLLVRRRLSRPAVV